MCVLILMSDTSRQSRCVLFTVAHWRVSIVIGRAGTPIIVGEIDFVSVRIVRVGIVLVVLVISILFFRTLFFRTLFSHIVVFCIPFSRTVTLLSFLSPPSISRLLGSLFSIPPPPYPSQRFILSLQVLRLEIVIQRIMGLRTQ